MQNHAVLKQHFERQLPAALDMLRKMVGINSYTANSEGVNRCGEFTAECFASMGFKAEFVPSFNPAFGKHLAMTRCGTGPHSIAMVSHIDTVFPPEEEARNNFKWSVEGDQIFGPGTEDIKGGTVMMWLLLDAFQTLNPKLFNEITWKLFLNSSEECFSPDFGEVCRKRMDHKTLAALVFEAEGRLGTESLMVVARKGRASWRVKVEGRGAHAGSKHNFGANAAIELGRIVQLIATFTDYKRELTFNVGTIHAGTVLNRIPHEAVAEGEFRAFTTEAYEHGKKSLLALAGPGEVNSPVDGYRCQVSVELLTETRPWPRNPATDDLYQHWDKAGKEVGVPINLQERGGLSDGNLIWDAVPTLDGLGPWGDNDHCSERSPDGSKQPEYVLISSFVPKAMVNFLAIESLAAK